MSVSQRVKGTLGPPTTPTGPETLGEAPLLEEHAIHHPPTSRAMLLVS